MELSAAPGSTRKVLTIPSDTAPEGIDAAIHCMMNLLRVREKYESPSAPVKRGFYRVPDDAESVAIRGRETNDGVGYVNLPKFV